MDDRSGWLTLQRTPGIGGQTFRALLERFGSVQQVLSASRKQLTDAGLKEASIEYLLAPELQLLQQDLDWLAQADHHLITIDQEDYPPLLRQLPDPPPLLFVCGDPSLLHLPQLAVVGSRNPTPLGDKTAHAFARHLVRQGLIITSGLAEGIDSAAHRGALDGPGKTIAIMGTGADRIYPARNRSLAHAIVEGGGALISELPLGSAPKPGHFPRRNRIISGLSVGTLVVEATLKSGSLITARLALEQGREVFAIPGSIHNPQARGCHALIRSGAKLVESSDDILEELPSLLCSLQHLCLPNSSPVETANTGLHRDSSYQQLLDNMGYEPVSVDLLVERSGLNAGEVASMLLLLELEGHVSSAAGGLYYRFPDTGN